MLYVMCQYKEFRNKILSLFNDVIFLQVPLTCHLKDSCFTTYFAVFSKCYVYQRLQCPYIKGLIFNCRLNSKALVQYMCMVCHEIHM